MLRSNGNHHPRSPEREVQIEAINSGKCLSKYDEKILEIDKTIDPWYFVVAGILSWLLLAGFLMSPSTYASVQESSALKNTGKVGESVMTAVRNVPLIYIASFACLIATAGLGLLWMKWRSNFIWVNRYLVV